MKWLKFNSPSMCQAENASHKLNIQTVYLVKELK